MTDRKPFVACGFFGVMISSVIGYNTIKHSRHILGVHANMITAVRAKKYNHVALPRFISYWSMNYPQNVYSEKV